MGDQKNVGVLKVLVQVFETIHLQPSFVGDIQIYILRLKRLSIYIYIYLVVFWKILYLASCGTHIVSMLINVFNITILHVMSLSERSNEYLFAIWRVALAR